MPNVWPQAIVTKIELAQIIKVAPRTVDNWIKSRRIPVIKLGASVRFNVADVMIALSKYTIREVE